MLDCSISCWRRFCTANTRARSQAGSATFQKDPVSKMAIIQEARWCCDTELHVQGSKYRQEVDKRGYLLLDVVSSNACSFLDGFSLQLLGSNITLFLVGRHLNPGQGRSPSRHCCKCTPGDTPASPAEKHWHSLAKLMAIIRSLSTPDNGITLHRQKSTTHACTAACTSSGYIV